MAYATREDIESLYGPQLVSIIADLTEDGQPEDVAVERALNEASSEIDTYLAVQYLTPINPAPPILVQLCRDMAIYRLALQSSVRTTEMRTRYEDAIKMLERIAAGKASLPPVDGDLNRDGEVNEDDDALAEALKRPYILRTVRNG
jgi:phage gp36-like protein